MDHGAAEKRKAQSLLNKLAEEAKFTAEVTIWGHGEDQYGPRMGRAAELAKRVADPKHPLLYGQARAAMRPQNYKKK